MPNPSESTRKLLSLAHRGKPQTPEHIAKRVEKLVGHEVSAETREKIGAPQRGRKLSEEHKAKLKKSPEQRAAAAQRKLGIPDSEKTRLKKAASAQARSLRAHEANITNETRCFCHRCF